MASRIRYRLNADAGSVPVSVFIMFFCSSLSYRSASSEGLRLVWHFGEIWSVSRQVKDSHLPSSAGIKTITNSQISAYWRVFLRELMCHPSALQR